MMYRLISQEMERTKKSERQSSRPTHTEAPKIKSDKDKAMDKQNELYGDVIQGIRSAISKTRVGNLSDILDNAKANFDSDRTKSVLSFALQIAIEQGNKNAVIISLDKGADVNKENSNWTYPLHDAAKYNQPAIAKVLLEKGADISLKNRHHNETALDVARKNNNREVAILIREKIQSNTQSLEKTPSENKSNLTMDK